MEPDRKGKIHPSGSEGENYPESLGNTFAVATMAGKDEASKQKSELWAADADAQSRRTAEDLTITELTTPVPGRNAQQNLGNDIHTDFQLGPTQV